MSATQTATSRRAFTLVELMITVAIIGVLAALAIYGVRAYLATAKSAEAKQHIGAITRAAIAAYQKELGPSEMLTGGNDASPASHQLCGTAQLVPATVPAGTKYQPSSQQGEDFQTGDHLTGWSCLGFALSQPTYFQLSYAKDDSPIAPDSPAKCDTDCFEAGARGDLDGDGVYGLFAMTGHIEPTSKLLKTATSIYVEREGE